MSRAQSARQYAKALLDTASADGALEAVAADFRDLGQLCATSRELRNFLASFYFLRPETRDSALAAVLGDSIAPFSRRFLAFLNEQKALHLLPDICENLARLYDHMSGRVQMRVTVSEAWTTERQTALDRELTAKFGPHEKPGFDVNPDLLGGFRIQANDQVYDYSVAGRLNALRRVLACA